MANDVKVVIDIQKAAGTIGFGIPLIIEPDASTAKSYTECKSLADVVKAGHTTDSNIYKAAALMFMQDNAPATIAVEATTDTLATWLADVANTSKAWRQLVPLTAPTNALLTAFESLDGKIAFWGVEDYAKLATLTATGLDRSMVFVCGADPVREEETAVVIRQAALVGATAGREAGSFTYKNMILKGIPPLDLSDTEIEQIHEKGGVTFITKAGDNVTSEGKALGGEYMDIVDSKDYIVQQIVYRTQKRLNTSAKIPYDNNGIAQLENEAITVLKDAANMGIIAYDTEAGNYLYSTNYALREDSTAEDRTARKYIGGSFSFELAGAIHTVEVTGEIII